MARQHIAILPATINHQLYHEILLRCGVRLRIAPKAILCHFTTTYLTLRFCANLDFQRDSKNAQNCRSRTPPLPQRAWALETDPLWHLAAMATYRILNIKCPTGDLHFETALYELPNTAPKHPQLHTRNRCGGPRITTEIKPMETGLRNSKEPQDPIPLGLGQTPSRRRTHQTTRNCAPGQFHAHRRDPTGENLLDEYRQQFPWIS